MKMDSPRFCQASLLLFVLLFVAFPHSLKGQGVVRRQSQKTNSSKPVVKKTSKPKVRNYGKLSEFFDSVAAIPSEADSVVAVVPDASQKEPKSLTMASGFELYGRSITDFSDNAMAQKALREALAANRRSKTGCLTNEKGMFVYGGNGYSSNGLTDDMKTALQYCCNNKYVINDVAFTDTGWWLVVFNGNKYLGSVPDECKKALDKYIAANDTLLSVSISENGNYAIVTNRHFDASNSFDHAKLQLAAERFGHIYGVCISNRGIIVTCSGGILFWDVPEKVIESLRMKNLIPRVVRYTDSGTFIAFDGEGRNAYYM